LSFICTNIVMPITPEAEMQELTEHRQHGRVERD
jgi:hypothetical protein